MTPSYVLPMLLGGQFRFDGDRESDNLTLAEKFSEILTKQLAGSLATLAEEDRRAELTDSG